MRTFKDNAGREWRLEINVASVKRVKEGADVLLTKLFESNCEAYAALFEDVCKLVEVLWCLCEKQADELGVTPEQFAEGIAGDSLADAADALGRAVVDFFPNQDQRNAIHALMDKAKQGTDLMMSKATEAIENLSPSLLANGGLQSVSSGQESQASPLGAIHSAN